MKRLPVIFYFILSRLIPESRKDILGDLIEEYQEGHTGFLAFFQLMWDCFSLIRLRLLFKRKNNHSSKTQNLMIKSHFKTAFRQQKKKLVFFLIKISGLAVSLTAALFMVIYLHNELSYDKHLQDYQNIYRITGKYSREGGNILFSAMTTYLLKPFMDEKIELNHSVRLDFGGDLVKVGNEYFMDEESIYADSGFFDVFQFQFLIGDPSTALKNPGQVVITEDAAKKYFNAIDVIGKYLEINEKTFSVSHVLKNIPQNTHFSGDILIPLHGIMDWYPNWVSRNASGTSHYTYVKVYSGTDVNSLEEILNEEVEKIWDYGGKSPEYVFQPMSDIHLKSDLSNEIEANGSEMMVYIFMVAVIGLVVLALINFTNLTLAGMIDRLREVGVKKVFGASKGLLRVQFQVESFLIFSSASLLVLLGFNVFRDFFENVSGMNIPLSWQLNLKIALILLGISLFLSMVMGSLTSSVFISNSAIRSLRQNFAAKSLNKNSLRNGLIIVQFLVASTLIFATITVQFQLDYLKNKNLGVDAKQLLLVPFQTDEMRGKFEVFKNDLLQNPQILNVSASNNKVTNEVGHFRAYEVSGNEADITCPTVIVSLDFFETMQTEFIEGRPFSRDMVSDKDKAYILNESAVKLMGLENPIGTGIIGTVYSGEQWDNKKATVIGVVKDFHFESLHHAIKPVVFSLSSEKTYPLSWMEIKVKPEELGKTISFLEEKWSSYEPQRPFYFEFMDQELEKNYKREANFLQIFRVFSAISIFIGCIGLFGLAAYMLKRRIKEVSIRKVLGARKTELLFLLSKNFLLIVFVSSVLAIPLAWWIVDSWLEGFAYRISIPFLHFLVVIIGIITVTFLVISYHVFKISTLNPANTMRDE